MESYKVRGEPSCNPELQEVKEVLIKRTEAEEFGKEVIALKNGIEIPHKSRLRSLCPYIDIYKLRNDISGRALTKRNCFKGTKKSNSTAT